MLMVLSGNYTKYFACQEDLAKYEGQRLDVPVYDTTLTSTQEVFLEFVETKIQCESISSNIYFSYLLIALGAAMVIGGFITN